MAINLSLIRFNKAHHGGRCKLDDDRTPSRVSSHSPETTTTPERSGLSIAGGILGIMGFVFGWIPVMGIGIGDLLGGLAVILGVSGLLFGHGREGRGVGMAVMGIVLGIMIILFKSIPVIKYL